MSLEELQLRRAVVCASGLIYWGGVLIQARRVRKQIGRAPNLRPRGTRERLLWFGWFMVILAWIGQPLAGTTIKTGLKLSAGWLHWTSLAAGLVLVALGYAGTLWTYSVMGSSWRIGINPREKTELVSSGPYRWVRHPIYLLQVIMLSGAALLLPTPVSFAILATHLLCVIVKARDEEKYLERVHEGAYRVYASRTGMLFPRSIRGGGNPTP